MKGMKHVPNIFMSFDKYLFLEVIKILIYIGLFNPLGTGDLIFYQSQGQCTFWGLFISFIKPVFHLL